MMASSSLEGHAPEAAADEDIRTWWSAKTGGKDEWLQIDLGETRDVRAVQVNLFEQDTALTPFEQDHHRFTLSASTDGENWKILVDRSQATAASPHAYVEFDKPVKARYLNLANLEMPGGGKFAVSDLRVFGNIGDPLPKAVSQLHVTRPKEDRRVVTLLWEVAEGAKEYVIRYGIAKDKLYQSQLVRADQRTEITLYSLNSEPAYFFRVDALNDAGVTVGTVTSGPH
jgi:hypothetical protein